MNYMNSKNSMNMWILSRTGGTIDGERFGGSEYILEGQEEMRRMKEIRDH